MVGLIGSVRPDYPLKGRLLFRMDGAVLSRG